MVDLKITTMKKDKDKHTIEGELRVKELLEQKGILMKDFASNIGIERETLTRTLKGNPRYDTLKCIADGLGITVPELFVSYNSTEAKEEQPVINGFMEIDGEVYSIKSAEQYMNLIEKIEGVVHIPSYSNIGIYEGAIRGFCRTSITEKKSGSRMMRYGVQEVFTLSYDAEAGKFSLTLCTSNGKVDFMQFDTIEYQLGDSLSEDNINELSQSIFNEIRGIYESDE